MKLRIQHTTVFAYDLPVSEAYTEMRLAPVDDASQRRMYFQLVTEPHGEVTCYTDRFNNEVHYFDILQPHSKLKVTATSQVLTVESFVDEQRELPPLDQYDYTMPSYYAPPDRIFRELAELCVNGDEFLNTALALMARVHDAIRYERGATDVKTKAGEALRIGRGVCQDFSHVMIAACRSVGLPARYVSGYLNSPGAQESGNAASHAWVDVFLPNTGWVSLDPTHNRMQNAQYVRMAVGRDYADVPPTRGVYKGSSKEELEVVVSVDVL